MILSAKGSVHENQGKERPGMFGTTATTADQPVRPRSLRTHDPITEINAIPKGTAATHPKKHQQPRSKRQPCHNTHHIQKCQDGPSHETICVEARLSVKASGSAMSRRSPNNTRNLIFED
jgi:hypothetical protein